MIPANRGWVAVFENDDRPNHTKPVVAWDDNGAALILDEKLGALRPARDFTNFLHGSAPAGRTIKPGGTMTPQDIRNRTAAINNIRHDDEAAHIKEDDLHQDVLQAIADGAADPAALAREALKTKDLDFARWYA